MITRMIFVAQHKRIIAVFVVMEIQQRDSLAVCVHSLSLICRGPVYSQAVWMCGTVGTLSNPLMREALIGCSGGRICSLKVVAANAAS